MGLALYTCYVELASSTAYEDTQDAPSQSPKNVPPVPRPRTPPTPPLLSLQLPSRTKQSAGPPRHPFIAPTNPTHVSQIPVPIVTIKTHRLAVTAKLLQIGHQKSVSKITKMYHDDWLVLICFHVNYFFYIRNKCAQLHNLILL